MALNGFRFAGLEISHLLSSRVAKLVVLAMAIIPCLFGALYAMAYHDPYNNFHDVPVAVVNLDKGVTVDSRFHNYGNDVCSEVENRTDGMSWHFVSASEAQAGLEAGEYYMVCTIPADFSERIASADSANPKQAQLSITYDESANPMAIKVGSAIWNRVVDTLNESISEKYWSNSLKRADKAGDSVAKSSNTAQQLADGLDLVSQGNNAITQGIEALGTVTGALGQGLGALASGMDGMGEGLDVLDQTGSALSQGVTAYADGINQIINTALGYVDQADDVLDSVIAFDENLQTQIEEMGGAEGVIEAARGLVAGLADPTTGLAAQLRAASAQLAQVQEGSLAKLQAALYDNEEGTGLNAQLDEAQAAVTLAQDSLAQDATTVEVAVPGIEPDKEAIANAQTLEGSVVSAYEYLAAAQDESLSDEERAQALANAQAALEESYGIAAAGAVSSAVSAGGEGVTTTVTVEASPEAGAALAQAQQALEAAQTTLGEPDDRLSDGATSVHAYANDVDSSLSAGQQALDATASLSDSLLAAAQNVELNLEAIDQILDAIQDGSLSLSAGAKQLKDMLASVETQAQALSAGGTLLAQGVTGYTQGISALTSALPQVVEGIGTVAQGADAIAQGADALVQGSEQMGEGMELAAETSQTLADDLSEDAKNLQMASSEIDARSEGSAVPIVIAETGYTTVRNYATGIIPLWLALGLWLGALLASLAIRPLNARMVAAGANPVATALAGFAPMALFALVQAVIACLVLQLLVGVVPQSLPAMYGLAILVSLAFAAVAHLLMAAFGLPGALAGLVLLALQLACCAGTFPIEAAAGLFQLISPAMPMTYAVEGLRQVISGVGFGLAAHDAQVLAGFAVAALALTSVVALRKRTFTMDALKPERVLQA